MTPSWDDTFLELAAVIAKRSKDPSAQVGALLVSPDRRQMSGGFNGFPTGVPDDRAVLAKRADMAPGEPFPSKALVNQIIETGGSYRVRQVPLGEGLGKHDLIVHAEVNAILNCHTRPQGWTLYCTHLPCVECAKAIVAAGVERVYAVGRRGRTDLGYDKAKQVFEIAGVELVVRETMIA